MSLWNTYLRPDSVGEALHALSDAQGPVAVIAGGTDLLLDLEQGRHEPVDTLVDVSDVEELRRISLEDDKLFIGAAVTHKTILDEPLVCEHARCLVQACGLIGGPQVRNVATLGGNVAHALPAGDGTIALMALEAEVLLASEQARTWAPLATLFAGPGQVTFDRRETLLVGFRFAVRRPGESSAFDRVMRPQGVAIAILNMGLWLRRTQQGALDAIRIAVGPGGPKPFRAFKAEASLQGQVPEGRALDYAKRLLLEEISLRTSRHRATEDYRKHLVPVLLDRTLQAALARLDQPALA